MTTRNAIRLMLLLLVLLLPKGINDIQARRSTEYCSVCMFQRDGNPLYILRRAIHESGPSEEQTFGHCYVCSICPWDTQPYCNGWWPADPDGGDYEGDEGKLLSDPDERWDSVSCMPATEAAVESLRAMLMEYSENHRYQVINQGGRSCLGFCEDVAAHLDWSIELPLGDKTIPGGLRVLFPEHHSQESAESAFALIKELRSELSKSEQSSQ